MAYGDLTTLGDVKAWLKTGQAAFPDTDDTLLTRLITAASRFIQNWLNRPIASADWQEVRDGTGGQRLTFANFPVTAVLSLSIDGLTIPPAPDEGGFGAGYVFSPTELALRGYVFTRRPQNVVDDLHRRLCGDSARHSAGLHRAGLPALQASAPASARCRGPSAAAKPSPTRSRT